MFNVKSEISENLDRLIAADTGDNDEPFCLACDPLPEKRGRRADPESRRFNQALHRIIRGKYDVGGVCHELSVLTGLSPEAIRSRVDSIEWDAPPEPLEPETCWTSDDRKYFGKLYGKTNDPEIRAFLQGLNGGQRRDPDRENARVRRQRIGDKMISISMGIERN